MHFPIKGRHDSNSAVGFLNIENFRHGTFPFCARVHVHTTFEASTGQEINVNLSLSTLMHFSPCFTLLLMHQHVHCPAGYEAFYFSVLARPFLALVDF